MKEKKVKSVLDIVGRVFLTLFSGSLIAAVVLGVYGYGYFKGFIAGQYDIEDSYSTYVTSMVKKIAEIENITPTPVVIVKEKEPEKVVVKSGSSLLRDSDWGGPDLWEAVNKRRKELGVNSLDPKDNLCTIASIRLNELLELGTLDGHEGFTNMTTRRPDLEGIFQSYSTVAEFLAAGAESPEETVSLWENSLGHKKLLTGGEFVWGCIYAQNSFAVAIAAY